MAYEAHFRVWRGDAEGGELEDYTVQVNAIQHHAVIGVLGGDAKVLGGPCQTFGGWVSDGHHVCPRVGGKRGQVGKRRPPACAYEPDPRPANRSWRHPLHLAPSGRKWPGPAVARAIPSAPTAFPGRADRGVRGSGRMPGAG